MLTWSDTTSFRIQTLDLSDLVSHEVLQNISFDYDAVGNITTVTDHSDTGAAKTVSYDYDDLYRLTSASTTAASSTAFSRTYGYNPLGNITYKSDQGSYAYTDTGYSNPHAATQINGVSLTYDNNGNVTSYGSSVYEWDYRNRMSASNSGSATTTYGYDHNAIRVMKAVGSTETYYANKFYNTGDDGTVRHIFDTAGTMIATVAAGAESSTSTEEVLYDDSLGTGWADWSYSASTSADSTVEVYNGTYSYEVEYTSAWGGFFLNHSGYDTTGSSHLAFYFNSGSAPPSRIIVKMHDENNGNMGEVELTDYTSSFSSDTWYDVAIPLTDIDAEGNATTTRGFTFISSDATTVFYDDIRFINVTTGSSTESAIQYIHPDHLGGTNVVSNEEGELVEVVDYYPFGEQRIDIDLTSFDEQRKFTGHEYDTDSDLTYAKARYYDQDIARWISQDTASKNYPQQFLTDPQQLNYYSYVSNNPIIGIDPYGLSEYIPNFSVPTLSNLLYSAMSFDSGGASRSQIDASFNQGVQNVAMTTGAVGVAAGALYPPTAPYVWSAGGNVALRYHIDSLDGSIDDTKLQYAGSAVFGALVPAVTAEATLVQGAANVAGLAALEGAFLDGSVNTNQVISSGFGYGAGRVMLGGHAASTAATSNMSLLSNAISNATRAVAELTASIAAFTSLSDNDSESIDE